MYGQEARTIVDAIEAAADQLCGETGRVPPADAARLLARLRPAFDLLERIPEAEQDAASIREMVRAFTLGARLLADRGDV